MPRPRQQLRFRLSRFQNRSGTKTWRVSGTAPDGTRIRKNFTEKADAIQALAELEGSSEEHVPDRRTIATRLSAAEVADAEAALIKSRGHSLLEIVAHYHSLQERAESRGLSLDAAVAFFERTYQHDVIEISIFNAVEEFVRTRAELTRRTRDGYRSGLMLLVKSDPQKPLRSFNVFDLERVLSQYGKTSTRRSYRRTFSVFFNWAVRHHYCLEDPCKRLDKLPKDLTEIAILSLEEVKRLLWAATHYQDGAAAAVVAIAVFAGLRPSELAELKPDDVGNERIRVTGGKLRRKLKRTVPIAPVLAAWLERFPFCGMPDGWDYKLKQLKNATKAEKWVQDILRHTSISFQTERDKNEALTAYNCGTSIKMMDLHYRNTIEDPKVVQAFWALTPDRVAAAKPKVTLPTRKRVEWPDKPALKKLVWSKPLMHAAKDVGVSDVALKKHCVKLGIELPPMGHWVRQTPARSS